MTSASTSPQADLLRLLFQPGDEVRDFGPALEASHGNLGTAVVPGDGKPLADVERAA